jgi:hypothetical protein
MSSMQIGHSNGSKFELSSSSDLESNSLVLSSSLPSTSSDISCVEVVLVVVVVVVVVVVEVVVEEGVDVVVSRGGAEGVVSKRSEKGSLFVRSLYC